MMAKKRNIKDKFIHGMCQRVKRVREDSGYTQETIAEALGDDVSYSAYQKYELNVPIPHIHLVSLCRLTGFSPWYFLTGKLDFNDRDKE